MSHRFKLILSVWGERHIDVFARVVLPSLMTSGNLLGFAPYDTELDIYTRKGDANAFIGLPALSALSGFIEVRITELELPEAALSNPVGRYRAMNAMHTYAMQRAAAHDATMMFLAPDAVFAEGTLANAREHILAGKRLVMIPTARASAHVVQTLLQECNPRGTFGMALTPRRLVGALLRQPYEQDRWRYWGGDRIVQSPSHVYFAAGHDGFVMRAFHLHPMAIHPQHWDADRGPSGTIDDTWLSNAVPDDALCHVTTDSDYGFAVDIATAADDSGHGSLSCEDAEGYVVNWARVRTDERQRAFARKNIYVHAGQVSQRWRSAARQADIVFNRILSSVNARDHAAEARAIA